MFLSSTTNLLSLYVEHKYKKEEGEMAKKKKTVKPVRATGWF